MEATAEVSKLWTQIQLFLSTTALEMVIKIAAAIAIWVIGRWAISKVRLVVHHALSKSKVDTTLAKYVETIIGVLLTLMLVLGVMGHLGIQTTSFAALLAGAGLAIGAAWGGLLSNFAAGVFLLVLRPFKVGDAVMIGGVGGTVKELGIFSTTLITGDNVLTTMGNNKIFSSDILNYSSLPYRRVDRSVQVAYGVNTEDAIARLMSAVLTIPHVLKDPAPVIIIQEFTAIGPILAVRPYCANDDYGQVAADTNAVIAKVAKEAVWPIPAQIRP